ncbi:MAG: NAD-dependent deacylase [Pseudomonadota bacterium]
MPEPIPEPVPGPEIVVLTGAGISAESGLGTFRDLGGVWTKVRLEEVATPQAFAADPARVQAFYNARRRQAQGAQPNAAHHALARMGRALGPRLLLVTQNVDDLHARAGSQPLHMHGSLFRAVCTACGARHDHRGDLDAATACPACGAAALRPDVVWFGEMPQGLDAIFGALAQCRVFAAIGTSGVVYPAAGFAQEAVAAGARAVEINLEATGNPAFREHHLGPATETVPLWVERTLAARA